jgi:hypothetical protein
MIKISELKEGDIIMVDNEGSMMEGEVMEVNNAQKLAQVRTNGENDFWYGGEALHPIMLSDAAMKLLKFERVNEEGGGVKYMKGAFRVHINKADDFSLLDFWYREDRRHVNQPISVHQLQNYYLSMTKVHLTEASI